MKRFILITVTLIISINISAQNIQYKQFALINYDLEITDEFRDDLKPVKKFLKSAEVHNDGTDDKLKAILVHHFYYHLAGKMEKQLEIDILPINTFQQEVKYDQFGYPKANINKILRIGDSPFYFKVKIHLDSNTKDKKKDNPKLKGDIIFPTIAIDVTVFNDEGIIPVFKWHGEKIAYKPFIVNERFFRTVVKDEQLPKKPKDLEKEQESLFELYSLAATNLIDNYKND
jgi:hypothetical protein